MSSTSDSTSPNPLDAISYGVGSDVGRSRDENQDSFGVIKQEGLKFFMVADGMGGVKGGAIASSIAVKTVEQCFSSSNAYSPEAVVASLSSANADIFKRGSEDESFQGMGTTFVGLAFSEKKMIITNVGDSRAYRIRGEKIVQLTEDHTLVNDLLKSGAISKEQAVNHPVGHMLTRSLGPCPDVDVDSFVCEDGPAASDRYVICSDGLYNVVKNEEILKIVSTASIDESIQQLISLANERGGPDNITVIIVQIDSSFPAQASDFVEATYPKTRTRKLPSADAYDIRATRESYRTREVPREHDDAEVSVSATAGPFGKVKPLAPTVMNASRIFPTLKWTGFIMLGLVSGFLLSEMVAYLSNSREQVVRTVLINPMATELAQIDLVKYPSSVPELQGELFAQERMTDTLVGLELPENLGNSSAISKSQMDGVIERKKSVEDSIVTLTAYLNSVEVINRAKLKNDKTRVEAQIQNLEGIVDRLTKAVATGSKNLAMWISRQKKLDDSDPVDMASEIAFGSKVVKEKKEMFEKATWAYLREVEVWRFNPNDKELAQRVSQLGKAREQRRLELAGIIKVAVVEGKSKGEEDLSKLSAELEKVEVELEASKAELEFLVKVLAGDDRALKAFKEELRRRLDLAHSELSELEKLLKSQ
jgi:serine/threonine protein phosphatase PrpC